jgi:hypothetical protein
MGEMKDILLWGGTKGIILLEGSQASPVRPSDKGSMKVEKLEWLQPVVRDKCRGIMIF